MGDALRCRRGHALPTAAVGPGSRLSPAHPIFPSATTAVTRGTEFTAVGCRQAEPALHATGRASRSRKATRSRGAPGRVNSVFGHREGRERMEAPAAALLGALVGALPPLAV